MKVCGKCGAEFSDDRCKECNRKRAKARYHANRERELARANAYAAAHREQRLAYSTAYYAANRDHSLKVSAEWRASHPDRVKEKNARWRSGNLEKAIAAARKYRRDKPEAKRLSEQKRRAAIKVGGGTLSKDIIAKLHRLQRGRCACCGFPLGRQYELDHIVPLSRGGAHADSNIQLLRKKCNQEKSAKHPVDFMQSRGFLL